MKDVVAEPLAGSGLSLEDDACATCHGEPDLWEADQARLFIPQESLAEDVHFLEGVNCHDCHGGDPAVFDPGSLHAQEDGFRTPLEETWKACVKCHEQQALGLGADVHAEAEKKAETDRDVPRACRACHGPKAHGIRSGRAGRTSVSVDNQIRFCGRCHEKPLDEYWASSHGRGLQRAGLLVTAICTDCHGAHGVYPASDKRSTLYPANVGATCAACHQLIEERLEESVHGRKDRSEREEGDEGAAENETSGEAPARTATCTDCHAGHESTRPGSTGFRLGLPNRCGHCHADLSGYAISMHGELSDLGYGPAATCADCHGAHDVLPVSDPRSKLSSANRLHTCRECHPRAPRNFADFDPHADHRNAKRDPVLHWVYLVLLTLLFSTFGFFGLHSVLWFIRGVIDVAKNGRPGALVPGRAAYVRFRPFHRVAHLVMVLSFLGLAATGLPLKYSHCEWAKVLAGTMGGFESTAFWHRLFGLVNVACLVLYGCRMLARLLAGWSRGVSPLRVVFGPDSPVPNFRDLKDLLKMIRWFFGVGRKPTFERWSYWEKFDFWGACADIVIIGATGLVLWFPNLFCLFLPGSALNIAKVIHSTQALLATGFVFAIHFFATHLRPEKFPMDKSVLIGLVSEKELEEERPEYIERMRREGKLDQLRTTVPSRDVLFLITLGGFTALAVGISLLAGILLAVLGG